jgi:hypothetical protein
MPAGTASTRTSGSSRALPWNWATTRGSSSRLLKSLVEARQPVGGLEMALVEDIALLFCKKARVDHSELAVQVSNLHQHDLERRKLCLEVGTCNSEAVEFEVREKGLHRFLDSPGKFEQVLSFLASQIAMIDKNEFGYGMKEALTVQQRNTRARERDAPAPAGETPPLRFSNLLNC